MRGRKQKKPQKIIFHNSNPSHLLIYRTKSIIKLIIFVLSFVLKAVLSNSKVCVGEIPILSNKE